VILDALRVGRGDVVAVAGAGGKTTLVYQLAREAGSRGLRVLVTTTTHMGTLPRETTGPVFVLSEGEPAAELAGALASEGRATLFGRRVREDKLEGVAPPDVDRLATLADLTLVEADGARQRSLKTPAPHEPVIPSSTTLFVVVAALDVLGQPLSDERVHRLERVLAASGRRLGEPVRVDDVAATLRDAVGYPARLRQGMRSAVFLNKSESEDAWESAALLAPRLQPPYGMVVAGSARAGVARALS
jgi:probable selenium-dependent hydroxylase accessory protein YqeC